MRELARPLVERVLAERVLAERLPAVRVPAERLLVVRVDDLLAAGMADSNLER